MALISFFILIHYLCQSYKRLQTKNKIWLIKNNVLSYLKVIQVYNKDYKKKKIRKFSYLANLLNLHSIKEI